MNDIKKANRCIRSLIRKTHGLRDGVPAILDDLNRVYRFSNVARINEREIAGCYAGFEEWLNSLIISKPMPSGIIALYFGLYDTKDGIALHVSGSGKWDIKKSDWVFHHDWFPEGGSIRLALYRDIAVIHSKHNYTGYYLAVAILAAMITEYAASSVISMLDAERQSLCISCGFDGGELYHVGELFDDGMLPLDGPGIWL